MEGAKKCDFRTFGAMVGLHKTGDLGTPQLMRQTENNLDCLTAENESQNNATSSIAVPLEEEIDVVAGCWCTPTPYPFYKASMKVSVAKKCCVLFGDKLKNNGISNTITRESILFS